MLSLRDSVLACVSTRMHVFLVADSAVYLYNSSWFKPRYLGGQVEVVFDVFNVAAAGEVRGGQEALSCE